MTKNYRFRQIRINKALYLGIKGYCLVKEKCISTFFEEVLEWFIHQSMTNHYLINYYASRQEDYRMTIRVSDKIASKINQLAANEKISDARIIFTALMLYLEEHQLQ